MVKTTIIFTSSLYGIRFYESRVELDDGTVKRIEIPVRALVRKGVIGNANGFRKAETWLNTAEGQKYVVTFLKPKARSAIGTTASPSEAEAVKGDSYET